MTHSAETTISLNCYKTLGLSRSKLKWWSNRFQFRSISEDSKAGIWLKGSSLWVCLVVVTDVNQGCCGSDLVTTTYLIRCCRLTWHIRAAISISHLSIPVIVVHDKCYISHRFYFFKFRSLLQSSFRMKISFIEDYKHYMLVIFNKRYFHPFLPNQFLVQVKLSFFFPCCSPYN